MRFLIVTDLEGVAGLDSFSQTRTRDLALKAPGMKQLAKEASAAAEGILSVYPDAQVDIWDGHGSGGMNKEDVTAGNYIPSGNKPYMDMADCTALLFVGQHAMVGTVNAPLCHTYSSLSVAYYKLNGVYVGEFGARAFVAGMQGVPTIFLAGDDKAALEAQQFVPEIETAIVKWGKGVEAAVHRSSEEACAVVREAAARAVRRYKEIPKFDSIQAPFEFEARYYNPVNREKWAERPDAEVIDDRTICIRTDDFRKLPF